MNIDEVWSNFFADNAPYSFDIALLDLGEKFESQPNWDDVEESSEIDGESYFKHRVVKSKSKLPQNPVSSYIDNVRNSYLLTMTDTALVIQDVNTGSGFKFADSSMTKLRWEVYQPNANSTRCVLRNSWHFEWIKKPWVTSGDIYDLTEQKIHETINYFWNTHLAKNVKRYTDKKSKGAQEAAMMEMLEEIEDLKSYIQN